MTTKAPDDLLEQPEVRTTWIEAVTTEWLHEGYPPALIHKGGTRSSKTYNICIAFAAHLSSTAGANDRLSIVRATNPALKATAWHDMKQVLRRMRLYDANRHNKTDQVYEFASGGIIDYFPSDDQKAHGRARDILWCNEANEVTLDEFDQLNLRTRKGVVLDFNPSMTTDHWIWNRYENSPEALWYTSTYKDNPFLPDEQIRKIEALKHQDPWKWTVYGLGMKGRPAAAIYHDVQALDVWQHQSSVLGLDFGYNDPMSLCRVQRKDGVPKPTLDIWALLHETHLTTDDLVERMPDLGVTKDERIVCDSAEPDRIEKLQRAGYDAVPADKGPGSVSAGIDALKSHRIRVGGPAGHRARQEFQGYRYKTHAATGEASDTPAKGNDHAPDAVRYAAMKELILPDANDPGAAFSSISSLN